MAKKKKKILPKNNKSTRSKKSGQKKTSLKSKKQVLKADKSHKSPKKTKSKTKKIDKKGGFAKNNFNFVRSLIWKQYSADFTSYFDPAFIRVVREIFNDCKAAGVVCTEDIIKLKYEQFKADDKRPKPYILPSLQQPKVYYEIKDVPFPTMQPYLYVVSPMILAYPHEFRITEYYKKYKDETGVEQLDIKGYDKFFADWVNWCNSAMRNEHGTMPDSEELEIFFKFSDSMYNEQKKRWEVFIYTCTPSGAVYNFGYKPEQGFEKTVEADYKIPSEEKLEEKPIDEQQDKKIKRIARKQKINDAIGGWNTLFSEIKISQKKKEHEVYMQSLESISKELDNIEKLIKKFKRKKNKRKVNELEKLYEKTSNKMIRMMKSYDKKRK